MNVRLGELCVNNESKQNKIPTHESYISKLEFVEKCLFWGGGDKNHGN